MIAKHRLAEVAALLADPSRAAMLGALQNGRAEPAGVLARTAGVSAATASAHLKKLSASGLIIETRSGRHRYFRLAGPDVNDALEALARLIPAVPRSATPPTPERQALCAARLCYDHLAGALGVAITDALIRNNALVVGRVGAALTIGPRASKVFAQIGIDIADLNNRSRPLVRSCLDWTERREHLAGALGAALAMAALEERWVARIRETRALRLTEPGRRTLSRIGVQV